MSGQQLATASSRKSVRMKTFGLAVWALTAMLGLAGARTVAAALDLSGIWQLRHDSKSVPQAALTPTARRATRGHQDRDIAGLRWCRIVGLPQQMDGPLDIQQGRIEIAIVTPMRSVARHLYTDGRSHVDLTDYDATTVGNSVAHWDGDALVVDTIGFTDRGLVGIPGGGFRTSQSHLVERYRLLNKGQQLLVTFTWTDSAVFVSPHSYEFRYFRAAANANVIEWPCDPFDPERERFFSSALNANRH
jgi:hypothetical protein